MTMVRIFKLLINFTLFYVVASVQFSLHIVDFKVYSDPDYGSSSCLVDKIADGTYRFEPVLSCNMSLKEALPCSLMSTLKVSRLDQHFIKEETFLEDSDIISNMLLKARGSIFGSVLKGFASCMNLDELCPLPANVSFEKCRINCELEGRPLSKNWKFYWSLVSELGKPILKVVTTAVLDDTVENREKRPTVAQRKRRKHG